MLLWIIGLILANECYSSTKSLIRHIHWPIFVILMNPGRKYPSISRRNWGQTRQNIAI